MLPLCAVCSVAIHSVLLTVPVAPEPVRQAARPGAGGPRAMHVRLQLSPSATGLAAVVARQQDPVQPTAAKLAVPVPATHEEAQATDITEAVEQFPLAAAAQVALPLAVSSTSTFAEHNEFVPRPLLSVPPSARTPVIFPTPPDETDIARYLGVLSLFIDEQGRVQYIAVDGPQLPPSLEQAAREAFMQAQFWPGQVDGQAVKSRQRVEVVFDNTPIPVH